MQDKLIKKILKALESLAIRIDIRVKNNLLDLNILSENVIASILSLIYDGKFENLNSISSNYQGVDLICREKGILVQVTSTANKKKIQTTLRKVFEKENINEIKELLFVILNTDDKFIKNFKLNKSEKELIENKLEFSKENILNLATIGKKLINLPYEKQIKIATILTDLNILLDDEKVITLEKEFERISDETNGYINKNYFYIDDKEFIKSFDRVFSNENVIKISSDNIDEGIHCVLNLISNQDKKILLIKDHEAWKAAVNYLKNCILITNIEDQDLKISDKNICIFVNSYKTDTTCLNLRRRQKRTLEFLLRQNDYPNAFELVSLNNGNYDLIYNDLANIKELKPSWVLKFPNKAIKIALILEQWHKTSEDIAFIEKLYESDYDSFMANLPINQNDANTSFLTLYKYSGRDSYKLTSFKKSWTHLGEKFEFNELRNYLDIIKEVLIKVSNTNEITLKEFLLEQQKNPNNIPSSFLIKGLTRSLILLADCDSHFQKMVEGMVRELLKEIKRIPQFNHIKLFISNLMQAAPDLFFDKLILENYFNQLTLEQLIELDSNSFLQFYLFGLEILAYSEEYSQEVLIKLLQLKEEYQTGLDRCIEDQIKKAFSLDFKYFNLNTEKRIKILRKFIKNDNYLWFLIYDQIKNPIFFPIPAFEFTRFNYKIDKNSFEERNKLIEAYIDLLLENCKSLNQFKKVIEIIEFFNERQLNYLEKILSDFYSKNSDNQKEKIGRTIRKKIHNLNKDFKRHSDLKNKLLNFLYQIEYLNPLYEYLYLSELNFPVLGTSFKNDYSQEDKLIRKNTFKNEVKKIIKNNKDLKSFLNIMSYEEQKTFGNNLAHNNSLKNNIEIDLFQLSLESKYNSFLISYIGFLDIKNRNQIIKNIYKSENENNELKIELLKMLSSEKIKKLYLDLSNSEKQMFWKEPLLFSSFEDNSILEFFLDESLKYHSLETFFFCLNEHIDLLSDKKLIAYLLNYVNNESDIIVNQHFYCENILTRIENLYQKNLVNKSLIENFELLLWIQGICSLNSLKALLSIYNKDPAIVFKFINFQSLSYKDKGSHYKGYSNRFLDELSFYLPGYCEGFFNNIKFNDWITNFNQLINDNNKKFAFNFLGKLFGINLISFDGNLKEPYSEIIVFLEESNQEIFETFSYEYFLQKQNIFQPIGDNKFKEWGEEAKEISENLSLDYPRVSKYFKEISKDFFQESLLCREEAEFSW